MKKAEDTIGVSDRYTLEKFGGPLNDQGVPEKKASGPSSIATTRREGLATGPTSGVPTLSYQGSNQSGGSYPPGSGYQSGHQDPALSGSLDHATASLPDSHRTGFHKAKDEWNLRQDVEQIMRRDQQTQNLGKGLVGPATPATTGTHTPSGSKGQPGQKKPDPRSGGQGGSGKGKGSGGSKK